MTDAARISLGFGFFVAMVLIGAAVFGVLSIGRPIRHIADVLLQLANGTREFKIPYTTRGDEVGDAARAASTFRDNLVRLEKLEAEQKETSERVMAERQGGGRGFAVVASEVKMLATQTAKATEAIKAQIDEMQATPRDSVAAIKEISSTIGRISEIAGMIATAIAVQSKATQEIAHNVTQAARGAAQVATNIAEVNQGAGETGNASVKVLQAAKFL